MTGDVDTLRGSGGAVRTDRDVVTVEGTDAASYLQGQVSADVDALGLGEAVWSYVLEPQGQVVAWFRLGRQADDAFVLSTDPGVGEALVARLERFRLRVDARIEVVDWQVVAVRHAPDAAATAAGVPGAAWVGAAGWPGVGGVDAIGPAVELPAGVPEVAAAALEVLRVEAGVPAHGAEIVDGSVPNELPMLAASVSFTKGCYTGQELVARVASRGNNVPRRIVGLTADEPVEPGAPITDSDGTPVGEVTSAAVSPSCGPVALGRVKRAVADDAAVAVAGVPARLVALPFVG